MKNIITCTLLIIVIMLSSCGSKLYQNFDYNYSSNSWKHAFKDRVFLSSLRAAYRSDPRIFELIEKKDAFNPYDGLSLDEMRKADSIGVLFIKQMPSPKMCENCGDGVNYFVASCLHFYNSKQLERITRTMYKSHAK